MDSFLNGGWVVGETLQCLGFLMVFCRKITWKLTWHRKIFWYENTFVWKLTFSRLEKCHLSIFHRKMHRRIDSAGGFFSSQAFPPPAPYVSYIKVGKSGQQTQLRRKKGWVWGCSLFEACWPASKNGGWKVAMTVVFSEVGDGLGLVFFVKRLCIAGKKNMTDNGLTSGVSLGPASNDLRGVYFPWTRAQAERFSRFFRLQG